MIYKTVSRHGFQVRKRTYHFCSFDFQGQNLVPKTVPKIWDNLSGYGQSANRNKNHQSIFINNLQRLKIHFRTAKSNIIEPPPPYFSYYKILIRLIFDLAHIWHRIQDNELRFRWLREKNVSFR